MVAKRILANRYELLEKIGSGGMAVVYRAYDTSLDRTVAIKLLRDEYADDPEFARRFQKEAQAVARLSHQNIVNIYDYGESDGTAYLVMEYVEGYTLKEMIAQTGPLPIRLMIDYSIQLCYGMAQAHNHDIVHKDIKPHNIMIDQNHTAKITDFGIAQAMNNLTITHNKGILGSAHYFSPEQARGDLIDFETDIYSLGIVMYEMLIGKVPFTGDNPVSVALKHMHDEPQSLVRQRADVPKELERIIFTALEKKPAYRFKSMQEMANALIDLQHQLEETGFYQNEDELTDDEKISVEPLEIERDHTRKEPLKRTAPANDHTRIMDYEPVRESVPVQERGMRKANKLNVFLLLLGAIALFFGTMWAVDFMMDSDEVEVPSLEDCTLLEAERLLSEASLKIVVEDEIYDEEVEKDIILSQRPKAGTKVKKGREITVVVSLGSTEVDVPDLYGKNKQQASVALENEELVLGEVMVVTDYNEPQGVVVYQSIEEGTTVKAGTSVDIMINDLKVKEVDLVSVPTLKGKTMEQAMQALRDAGLEAGMVNQVSSKEYYKDYVISQQAPAGSEVESGSAIGFTVSSGPGPGQAAQFYITVPEDGKIVVTLIDDAGTSVLYQKDCQTGDRLEQSFLYHGEGKVIITCDGKEIWSKAYGS